MLKINCQQIKDFITQPVSEKLNKYLYAFAGVGIGVNLFVACYYIFCTDDWSDALVHIILMVLAFAYAFAYYCDFVSRILVPTFLMIVALVIAIMSVFAQDTLENFATIFGITSFIWLLFENVKKSSD